MTRRILAFLFTFIVGAVVGNMAIPHGVVLAQTRKPVLLTRIYTGPDNQSHAEEVEMKFPGDVSKLLQVTGAELHRASPGRVSDWHRGPSHRYVITLSGQGEVEVAGGKKISLGPGSIDLIEDTTGKGHITRDTGTQDRVTLHLLLADPVGR